MRTGEEPEGELVALGSALSMEADPRALVKRGPTPQVEICRSKRVEHREGRRGILARRMEHVDPAILVVRQELRPVLGEDPAVAARHDELGIGDMADQAEHAPFAVRRDLAKIRAGIRDQLAQGIRGAGLRDRRIVVAERVEQVALVARGLGDRIGRCHPEVPPSSSDRNPSASSTVMPSSSALASFEPAPGPATM